MEGLACTDPGARTHIGASGNFSLPNHEKEMLSYEQSAERIAVHFSSISQEFPSLDVDTLLLHVQSKLKCEDSPL